MGIDISSTTKLSPSEIEILKTCADIVNSVANEVLAKRFAVMLEQAVLRIFQINFEADSVFWVIPSVF